MYHCVAPAGVQITTDGRHAYLFEAGWPVGTAWASLGSAQHWFTITLVMSVDWKNSKQAFFLSFVKQIRTNNWSSLQCCESVRDRDHNLLGLSTEKIYSLSEYQERRAYGYLEVSVEEFLFCPELLINCIVISELWRKGADGITRSALLRTMVTLIAGDDSSEKSHYQQQRLRSCLISVFFHMQETMICVVIECLFLYV